MKMSRRGIVTSGRRPARPDAMYYREARRRSLSRGGRRTRGRVGLVIIVAAVFVVLAIWIL